ncbi:unnamed protein product [Caenorhabditis bovis]|uniref:Ral GTPase-activating protein subunit alpha/beta N-terminal domain-containing protein n=1 Tax=Caenorhabditis bovis TaxID=2654633 RepID=A0A8S1FEL9_9PELO|nr:unnamed protein product [Caenorhabditis bovis]
MRKLSLLSGYNKELPTLTEGVIGNSAADDVDDSPAANNNNNNNSKQKRHQGSLQVRLCGEMYEQWPTLEFSDLSSSILDLFTKSTSQSVSSSLIYELTRSDSDENGASIRLNSEEHLKWCMQVLNHSLTLSFATSREYETLKGAVRIYLHWLRALCDTPDNNIPTPLLETPEKYFRNIIDALRWVFCRRDDDLDSTITTPHHVPKGLAIERQSIEIEMVLDQIKLLTRNSSRKYLDEVWARSLSFLLNSADLLLSEPNTADEMGSRICVRVADTVFEMWLNAVLNEHIPSLTYWSSLASLARRWRHNVPIIECWAQKILGLTVLVCKKMYGDDYLKIQIHDENIAPFGNVPILQDDDEEEIHLLYRTWYNMLCLFDCPAKILTHDPMRNESLNGKWPRRTVSSISTTNHDLASASASQGVAFFLAATTIQRLVDLFYGDSRVLIDLRSTGTDTIKASQTGTRQASTITDGHSHYTHRTASTTGESGRYVSLNGAVGQMIIDEAQPSMASGSNSSGKTYAESRRDQRSTVTDRNKDASNRTTSVTESTISAQSRASEQTSSTLTYRSAPVPEGTAHGESISHIVANSTASAPVFSETNQQQPTTQASTRVKAQAPPPPSTSEIAGPYKYANQFVTNFLAWNPGNMPMSNSSRKPKTDRMLKLVGDWLFSMANCTPPRIHGYPTTSQTRKHNDGVSDGALNFLKLLG